MNILNIGFDEITFEMVEEHCISGHPEGIQLDYKEEYPSKDLSKLISAFSNTRGGTIIVGVKENRQSGLPEKWIGIEQDAKIIERVHQQALSVTPLPKYHVRFTNIKDTKVFLILRVDEGDSTPYYVKNDSNIWTRTGNIRNPVEIATPEWQELLYRKRGTAEKARKNYLTLANTVFDHALLLEDRRRLGLIAETVKKGDGSEKQYYPKQLGTDVEWCSLYIQPYFPRQEIIKPKDLLDKLHDLRHSNNYAEYPNSSARTHTIPEGVYIISHSFDGSVDCQQLYSSGLLFHRFDILRPNGESGRPTVYLSHLLSNYIQLIQVANNLYQMCGYQGQIKTRIELNLTRDNIQIVGLSQGDPFFWDHYKDVLLPKYEWDFSFDTVLINDQKELATKIIEITKNIHWDLGFSDVNQVLINKFLTSHGLLDEPSTQ